MNPEQQKAYEWAKNQNYQSVAAQYAKILADLISLLQADLARVTAERDAAGNIDDNAIVLNFGDGDLGIGAFGFHGTSLADGVAIFRLKQRCPIGMVAERGTFIDALRNALVTMHFKNAESARVVANVFIAVAESLEKQTKGEQE